MQVINVTQVALLSTLFFVGYGSLLGMEKHDFEFDKSLITEVIIPKCYDDQRTWADVQRTWARVNRTYNKIIEDRYRPDKKRIDEYIQKKKIFEITDTFLWNKDFTRCAWVKGDFKQRSFYLNLLAMDRNNNVKLKAARWDGMRYYIDKPFFQDGAICMHGYGWNQHHPYHWQVNRYSLNFDYRERDDNKKISACWIAYINNDGLNCFLDLRYFLEYPIFLRAILKSKKCIIHSQKVSWSFTETLSYCSYFIERAMIPENYKKYLPCEDGCGTDPFISMSQLFMQVIEKRLEEQKVTEIKYA